MNAPTRQVTLACLAALILSLPSGIAAEAPGPRPGRPELSDFKIIEDRNIFNPSRYARSTNSTRRASSRTVASDNLILTGVIAYEKGTFAFFEGSSSDYRKVVKPGESLSEFKVVEIQPQWVKLALGTNDFELPVGNQMRKEQDGAWRLAGRVESPSSAPGSLSGPSSSSSPGSRLTVTTTNATTLEPPSEFFMPGEPPESGGFVEGGPPPEVAAQTAPPPEDATPSANGGTEDDVLRRLMQRREQELNQ